MQIGSGWQSKSAEFGFSEGMILGIHIGILLHTYTHVCVYVFSLYGESSISVYKDLCEPRSCHNFTKR